MTRVATYVFLDLETTGIPKQELNKTKITELSMVVVRRRHVLDTRPGAAPRVQEKLTLCFNPRRMIHPESTEASGLDNDLLEHQTPFNMNVFTTLNSFLQCFEKPVCLVAQNGHSFDFPILKNHFEKLGVSLADDILCADSLDGFYDIDVRRDKNSAGEPCVAVAGQKTDNVDATDSSSDQIQLNVVSENNSDRNDSSGDQIQNNGISADIVEAGKSPDKESNDSNAHHEEHITPELLKDFLEFDDIDWQRQMQLQNERTPVQVKRVPEQNKNRNKVKRRLFYNKDGTWPCKAPNKSYKLLNIYERVVGRPGIEAHRAENDCVMAMEVSVALGNDFVEWIDNNHCKFSEVKAMKLGVPLGE